MKKIVKYFIAIWIIATIIFVVMANRGLHQMFGGLTNEVDYTQFDAKMTPVAISNINILAPDGLSFIAGQTVYINDGLIVSIDTLGKDMPHVQIINGEGKYLIPGLTDAHIHLFRSPNDLLLYVANGVTQVRELIGEEKHLKWKQEIKDGRIGPDMYVASPRLGSFGLMEGWFMSWSQGFDNITNAKEAEKAVREYHRKGYDGIKVYSQLNKESYEAICKTAQSLDMPVMGHIPLSTELSDIYQSSQSEIAHFEEIMNALNREFGYYNWENEEDFFAFINKRSEEVANNLINNNIVVTSTLWGTENMMNHKFNLEASLREVELEYVNPGLVEWSEYAPGGLGWLPEVYRNKLPENLTPDEIAGRKGYWKTYAEAEKLVAKNMIDLGVKIMAGTDANIPLKVPGFSLHDELESLNNAGMTPAHILQSATSIPAEWMNNNAGKILIGRKANLVLLDQNPIHNISNTRTINTVILNGRILDRTILDEMLNEVKKTNNSSRKKDISQYIMMEK